METNELQSPFDVRIGKIRVPHGLGLAPMAGATSLPFRLLCRNYGAGITITEMVSAKGLILGSDKTLKYLERGETENPVGAQVFGSEATFLSEAAKRIEQQGFHLVDVNMGCPVKKVTTTGAGCALMKDPAHAGRLIEGMVKATALPVTVKIRAGWDDQSKNAPQVAKALQEAGAAAVTVHARTREQSYSGNADWELIGRVKEAVRIPVFGNGDIDTPEKAEHLRTIAGCDGVTIGRGALKRPWIFRDIRELRNTGTVPPAPSLPQIGTMLLAFAQNLIRLHGEATAVLMMRRLGAGFSKGIEGGADFRTSLVRVATFAELQDLTSRFFREADVRAEEPPELLTNS